MQPHRLSLLILLLLLLLSACGDDQPAETTATPPTTTAALTTTLPPMTTTSLPPTTTTAAPRNDPIESVQAFAGYLRQGDIEAAAAFLAPTHATYESPELFNLGYWEWLSIMEKPEFTDCKVVAELATGSKISCTSRGGEDTWYSRVMGSQPTTTFTPFVDMEGVLTPAFSNIPPGEFEAEVDFREWIRATHPADEDRMFGNDYLEIFRFSKESAELHMQYLDEYLTYKETNE